MTETTLRFVETIDEMGKVTLTATIETDVEQQRKTATGDAIMAFAALRLFKAGTLQTLAPLILKDIIKPQVSQDVGPTNG